MTCAIKQMEFLKVALDIVLNKCQDLTGVLVFSATVAYMSMWRSLSNNICKCMNTFWDFVIFRSFWVRLEWMSSDFSAGALVCKVNAKTQLGTNRLSRSELKTWYYLKWLNTKRKNLWKKVIIYVQSSYPFHRNTTFLNDQTVGNSFLKLMNGKSKRRKFFICTGVDVSTVHSLITTSGARICVY